jgi:hypothetical protein
LLELLAAAGRVDRRPHVRRVAVRAHADDVLLRYDEAFDNRHATILSTQRGGVNDCGYARIMAVIEAVGLKRTFELGSRRRATLEAA